MKYEELVKRLRDNGYSLTHRERSKAADAIEAMAANEPKCAVVKPLAWITLEVSDWLKVYDGPACAKITAIHRVPPKSGMGAPVYSEPLTIRPEAEVRAEAWAAALEAAALKMAKGGLHTVWDRSEAIRTLTPPSDIATTLDRIKADAKAEGMREAAAIAKSRAGSPGYEPPSPYDRGYAAAVAEVDRAILAAIPKPAIAAGEANTTEVTK